MAEEKKMKMAFVRIMIVTDKVTLWSASYSACVVYIKAIAGENVGESGGYLPNGWCFMGAPHFRLG